MLIAYKQLVNNILFSPVILAFAFFICYLTENHHGTMFQHIVRLFFCCQSIILLPLLQGLEVKDNGEVVYRETSIEGVVEHAVTIECGSTLPNIYIWSFTKPGTDTIRAVVFNFGGGPKLQKLAETLGNLSVVGNSASLAISKLPVDAEGLYTCQALYDSPQGVRLYYYYVRLFVLVPVSKPYIVLSDASPVEGTSMWMLCALEEGTGPINYTWEQEGQDGAIRTLAQSNSSLFNIPWVARNLTGRYRCLAKNQVNQQWSDQTWIDIIFGPDIPHIDIIPNSITTQGYSVLEKETISFICQTSSNPPSNYVWIYNSSKVAVGPQYTINRILRSQTGSYTCQVQGTYFNASSKKTVSLDVYYPPEGFPICNIYPANNYNDLNLWCSWYGGFPEAMMYWSPFPPGKNGQGYSNATLIQLGPDTANNSVFVCYGSHAALNVSPNCSIQTLAVHRKEVIWD
ncbi:V-set and immunoglobulin domain-containing protein 10-like 2 [Denticeps clupeoides]|uniref:V-set and immunoglobulin domain-containing protein 10-like 2 n=1 Tax=Denticeps clupeoides TaxID=299321 RepID=UPI0010A39CA6|nr:V-set and immunoglobulin domain-containing protein 10-like 2 [Denticeps clupeoides]